MSDCKDGKDFNPKTCRYIQSCKPGYSRNKDFKCVKNPDAPKRSVGKEKLGLLKGLFSNSRSNLVTNNGLINSPTLSTSKSKRLKRTKKTYPDLVFNENGNEIPPLEPISNQSNESKQSKSKAMKEFSKKFTQAKIKSMKDFLKTLTPSEKIKSGKEINWNQMKTLARSKGIKLDTDDDKRIFKDLVVESQSGKLKTPKRLLKTKKVQFENTNNPLTAIERAKMNQSNANSSKTKKSFKSKTPKSSNPKGNISRVSKSNPAPKKSLSKMTIKDALEIMKINEIYTINDLAKKYKEISTELHPDKSFDEKKTTPEFKVLNKAFEILKKRIDKSGISKPLRKSGKSESGTKKSKKSKIVISKVQSNESDNSLKNVSIPTDDTIINLHNSNLYNPETVFKFYSLSADRAPGKGPGEKIKSGDESKYLRLSERPDWRKMLSNFWIEPFELEGKRWQSVEHYYQGSKFKKTPDFYNQFSLDSGSDTSKDPGLAKAAGGKSGKRKGIFIRPKEIKIDSDFFPNRSKIEMYKAQHAKFTQNVGLSSVLKLTRDAKLVHHVRGSLPVVFDNLMYIRSKL